VQTTINNTYIYEAELHFVLKSDVLTVLVTHKLPIEAESRKEAYQKALMKASHTLDNYNVDTSNSNLMEYIGMSALNHNPVIPTNQPTQLQLSETMLENEKELSHLIRELRVHNLNIQQDLAQVTV